MTSGSDRALERAFQSNTRYFQIMRAHHERRGIGLEPEMKSLLTSVRGGSVLDVGCGEGSILRWLASLGLNDEYVGIDISPIGTAMARSREDGTGARFIVGNLKAMPFPAARFDLVYAQSVLEHVGDYRRAIAECARVVKPGGLLAIRLPNGARETSGVASALLRHVFRRNGVRSLEPSLRLERDEDSVENFDACRIPSEVLRRELEEQGLTISFFTTRRSTIVARRRSWLDGIARRAVATLPFYPFPHLGPTTIVGARRPGTRRHTLGEDAELEPEFRRAA